MDFLSEMGELMRREGLLELEIRDAGREIVLRRSPGGGPAAPAGEGPGEEDATVTAPLAGILCLSPGSGQEPYAAPGELKERGDTLFCIEAMKHINEVYAEYRLTVEEVLAAEGDPVSPRLAVMRVRREAEPETDAGTTMEAEDE